MNTITYEIRGYLTQSDFESSRIFDYLASGIESRKQARQQAKSILRDSNYRIVKIVSEDEEYNFTELWEAVIKIVRKHF